MPPLPRSYRPLIMGRRGAVASNHPLATQAGLDVLRSGGNAVDATVAVALALGVVEPHMSGIGGDGFYHLWTAADRTGRTWNGTGPAGEKATPEAYADGIPIGGPRSVQTPGFLGALGAVHRAHGSKPWAELCRPAIGLARDGFAATHAYRNFALQMQATLAADPISRTVFLHDGQVPALGALILQPALADTLEQIAAEGAESFYRGRLAAALVEAFGQVGVALTAADLANYQPEQQAPIAVTYRGYEVRQTPPNSTGFTMLQELKIVEQFDLSEISYGSAQLVHLLVEAKKRAFLDRERHGTDPRYGEIPLERLLSEAHAAELARGIDREVASDLPLTGAGRGDGNTTYFCVVDEAGNAMSAIQSINHPFGSGVTAGATGILLNNRMSYWHLEPGHANQLQPGKRVRHTMNAPMVLRDGRPWAVFGTPGADNQVQINLQVAVAMIDYGLDPQQALEAPRWSSNQKGQDANYPHTGEDALTLESNFAARTVEGLRVTGHKINLVAPLEGPCSVECIRILDNGVRMAGSDPRRDGWAGAY